MTALAVPVLTLWGLIGLVVPKTVRFRSRWQALLALTCLVPGMGLMLIVSAMDADQGNGTGAGVGGLVLIGVWALIAYVIYSALTARPKAMPVEPKPVNHNQTDERHRPRPIQIALPARTEPVTIGHEQASAASPPTMAPPVAPAWTEPNPVNRERGEALREQRLSLLAQRAVAEPVVEPGPVGKRADDRTSSLQSPARSVHSHEKLRIIQQLAQQCTGVLKTFPISQTCTCGHISYRSVADLTADAGLICDGCGETGILKDEEMAGLADKLVGVFSNLNALLTKREFDRNEVEYFLKYRTFSDEIVLDMLAKNYTPQPRRRKGEYPASVVGEQYYAEAVAQTEPGDEAWFVREPDNPHDPKAVAVKCTAGHIGYLPRDSWVRDIILDGGYPDARIYRNDPGEKGFRQIVLLVKPDEQDEWNEWD